MHAYQHHTSVRPWQLIFIAVYRCVACMATFVQHKCPAQGQAEVLIGLNPHLRALCSSTLFP
jgi:hypothetical protein